MRPNNGSIFIGSINLGHLIKWKDAFLTLNALFRSEIINPLWKLTFTLVPVRIAGKWGYIDKTGNYIWSPTS